jgi:hypothetical protein
VMSQCPVLNKNSIRRSVVAASNLSSVEAEAMSPPGAGQRGHTILMNRPESSVELQQSSRQFGLSDRSLSKTRRTPIAPSLFPHWAPHAVEDCVLDRRDIESERSEADIKKGGTNSEQEEGEERCDVQAGVVSG